MCLQFELTDYLIGEKVKGLKGPVQTYNHSLTKILNYLFAILRLTNQQTSSEKLF